MVLVIEIQRNTYSVACAHGSRQRNNTVFGPSLTLTLTLSLSLSLSLSHTHTHTWFLPPQFLTFLHQVTTQRFSLSATRIGLWFEVVSGSVWFRLSVVVPSSSLGVALRSVALRLRPSVQYSVLSSSVLFCDIACIPSRRRISVHWYRYRCSPYGGQVS